MSQSFRSELIGTAGLTVATIAALLLTVFRVPVDARADERRRTTMLFVAGVALQTLHFAEEYSTRFFERFPPVLGEPPWSASFFVIFNVFWLGVWVLAAFGFQAGYRAAFFPVWFFAIAAVANGIAHPLLALRAGGYFPGLLTSPLLAVVGVWLWLRLVAMTSPRAGSASARPTKQGTI
jgi:hypothetical protein